MTNGLANRATARVAPVLTSVRRSMPARQCGVGTVCSLVWMTSFKRGASASSLTILLMDRAAPSYLRRQSVKLGGAIGETAYGIILLSRNGPWRQGAPGGHPPKITRRKRTLAT